MSIQFPNFKKLELSDQQEIESFTEGFLPYSDFRFSSLWAYNTNNFTEFTFLNNNLVIKHGDYVTGEPMFSFIGDNNTEETVGTLFTYLKDCKLPEQLSVIPEDSIKDLRSNSNLELNIAEDPDQSDYIIPLKESSEAKNINPHKLKALSEFKINSPNFFLKNLSLKDLGTQKEVFNLFDLWAKKRNRPNEVSNIERIATKRIIEISNLLNLLALGLYVDGKMIGYIIDEYLSHTYVIGHFIKADTAYKGIYELINQESAKIHTNAGYKYINIEQDLGIPGLRTSKMQRSPSFFLKKYKITRSN